MELETLLTEGREMIDRTTRRTRERWGLGSAQRWVLNQDDGRIVWSFDDHVASAPAQILGSWNGEVSSFVWSWDNDSVRRRCARPPTRCAPSAPRTAWSR